jgi:hypothetical protein
MSHPSPETPSQQPQNSPERFDQGLTPCWEHTQALGKALLEFGIPENMHPIGHFEGLGDPPPPALLGGLGEGHTSFPEGTLPAVENARSLALQMLQAHPPGTVRMSVYDGQLRGAFGDFAALGPKLFEQVEPGKLQGLLNDIMGDISRLSTGNSRIGTPSEPWHIAIIDGAGLNAQQREQLERVINAGPQWGSAIVLGEQLDESVWLQQGFGHGLRFQPNPQVPSPVVGATCAEIASQADLGRKSPDLSSIITSDVWTKISTGGLETPIGIGPDGKPYEVVLGDRNPHAIITGPSGSGKSVLIKGMLTSMTQAYGPDQVQMLMLDFKEGAEFASFAPNALDDSYLPHAKLVGTSVNEDPEFGITTLKYLQQEITRRSNAAKKVGANDYAQLRENDPNGDWPRLVTVIDEFQVLLEGPRASEAVELLTDISRRGRSSGIHTILASQSIEGLNALYAKDKSLFKNYTLRLSTPNGSLLNHENTLPQEIPRFHAVVNENSGNPNDNVVIEVAAAVPNQVSVYQKRAFDNRPADSRPPHIFDGGTVPSLDNAREFQKLKKVEMKPPKVLLADEISVDGGSAGFLLSRQPGRNVAVVGQRTTEVGRVLYTAAQSLAKQVQPESADFSVVCIDDQMGAAVDATVRDMREKGHNVNVVGPEDAANFFTSTNRELSATTRPSKRHYVLVYGADSGGSLMTEPPVIPHTFALEEGMKAKSFNGATIKPGEVVAQTPDGSRQIRADRLVDAGKLEIRDSEVVVMETGQPGRESLRSILEKGPEKGTHIIASFSSAGRLKETATKGIGGTEAIGSYIAIGVPPNEMNSFTPDSSFDVSANSKSGSDRANRAQFYDRTAGKKPRTVIPYEGPDGVEQDEDEI